jgi:hypothetical protein
MTERSRYHRLACRGPFSSRRGQTGLARCVPSSSHCGDQPFEEGNREQEDEEQQLFERHGFPCELARYLIGGAERLPSSAIDSRIVESAWMFCMR